MLSGDHQLLVEEEEEQEQPQKKPLFERYKGGIICGVFLLVIAIILGIAAAVFFTSTNDQPSMTAPEKFQVEIGTTSNGTIVLEITRSLAPYGVERVFQLLTANGTSYYNDNAFFRVLPMGVTFGINGNPSVSSYWQTTIEDDVVQTPNVMGMVALAATPLANSRSTKLFINLQTNEALDSERFAPIGKVIQGMDVVQSLYSQYGDSPDEVQIYDQGNAYLMAQFPSLDYTTSTSVILL